jgi:TolB-like protein/Flp pilus assembly protein TadD
MECFAAGGIEQRKSGAACVKRLYILKATSTAMNAKKFFTELKRRKVYRVAVAYAVIAWLLIQIATQTFPFFEIPAWTVRLIIVALGLGFPVALLLSWAFDLTPGGIKRTDDLDEAKTPAPIPVAKPSVPRPEKSIAVLPFENLSDDQQNTYFADGIQDDILSSLAKVADLKVISRTSVRQYRSGTRNLREIGEALGVAYVMEGTVRREANRVRINAQLIDARTDLHVWNDTYDREITDLFGLQTELARRIAFALRANLSPREKASLQVHPTSDLDAYDLFLRARDLFRWSGSGDPRENGERALRLLDEAVGRDPYFALAYCLISRFHGELYWFGYDRTRERLTQAKIAADTALRLQPDSSDVRLALAFYYYYGYRDYELARTELAIAHEAAPNDAEVWDAAAAVDRRQGRWEDAVANFEKAKELDPRNPSVLWNLAETYACLGRYDNAARSFADAIEVYPASHLFSIARAAIALRTHGNLEPLCSVLCNIPADFDPGGGVTNIALRVYLSARDYDEAERWLKKSRSDRFNDIGVGGPAAILDGYTFPRAWYEGLIARGRGEEDAAGRAFRAAQRTVEADLANAPDDPKLVAMLGLVHAMKGRHEEAIAAGRRAVELLPISRDAYDGPLIAAKLAVIYAQAGENDRAIELMTALVAIPNGPTPGTLRIEREWDPLRGDPRFDRLMEPTRPRAG